MDKNVKEEKIEITRGSGNVYEDFGYPDAEVRQAKAILAAEIIGIMRVQKLTNRQAEKITGVSHTEFSRIRKPDLKRFTLDRLITIVMKLDPEIDINIEIQPRPKGKRKPSHPAEINL